MVAARSFDQILAASQFFGGLSASVRATCARAASRRHWAPGEVIFCRGDPGTAAYLVAEGRVRLALLSAEGRELSVRIAHPGDVFGEISALDGAARSANAEALTEAVVWSIPAQVLAGLLRAEPEFAAAVVGTLCARLRATTSQLEALAFHNVDMRLVQFLLELAGEGVGTVIVHPGLTQGEIAKLLGCSRAKLNVAFGVLARLGLVRPVAGGLACDRERLLALLQTSDD